MLSTSRNLVGELKKIKKTSKLLWVIADLRKSKTLDVVIVQKHQML